MNNSVQNVQKIQYVHNTCGYIMKTTVKARIHYGADSLDLTIPVDIKRKYGIEVGDVFELSLDTSGTHDELILSYRRVYSVKQ